MPTTSIVTAVENGSKCVLFGAGQHLVAIDERPPAEMRSAPRRQLLRLEISGVPRARQAVSPDAETAIEDHVENGPLSGNYVSHICSVLHLFKRQPRFWV